MIVTLLTDYGNDDEFAGICHGVIAKIAPEARLIDITHGIPRHDIRRGAIVLRNAIDYVPKGVHLAVVDPTVGTPRRAVAVLCGDGHLLVGPDNGLLSLAWERCGGAVEAVDLNLSPFRLEPVSATFHGRDLFAPAAAHLAIGATLDDAGERVDTEELVRLALPASEVVDGVVHAHALIIDRYGNVGLNLTHEELAGTGLALGRSLRIEVTRLLARGRLRPHLRRRARGCPHRLRGRVPLAGAGHQPRQRGGAARAEQRTIRSACRPNDPRHAPRPSPADRLDQRAGAGARARRRAARHPGHSRRADGRAWAIGPDVVGQAGERPADVGPDQGPLRTSRNAPPRRSRGRFARRVEEVTSVTCAIKWPNDVWIDRRKLAGILIEGRPQEGWAVIGIGLNVSTTPEEFPEELRDTATSLLNAGAKTSRQELLDVLLARLSEGLEAPHAEILSAWRSRDALKGTEITWDAGSGTAAGIDDEGSLLVDTAAGRLALGAGEVHLGRV